MKVFGRFQMCAPNPLGAAFPSVFNVPQKGSLLGVSVESHLIMRTQRFSIHVAVKAHRRKMTTWLLLVLLKWPQPQGVPGGHRPRMHQSTLRRTVYYHPNKRAPFFLRRLSKIAKDQRVTAGGHIPSFTGWIRLTCTISLCTAVGHPFSPLPMLLN
jgi:hypothetical protein